MENVFIESFNSSLRKECLNVHWFQTLAEAEQTIEAWRREYNEKRPHSSLGNRTPMEYTRDQEPRTSEAENSTLKFV